MQWTLHHVRPGKTPEEEEQKHAGEVVQRYKIVGDVGDVQRDIDLETMEKYIEGMPDFLSEKPKGAFTVTECLALISVGPLEELYARHLFSAFIWSIAKHARLEGPTKTNDIFEHPGQPEKGNSYWSELRMEHSALSSLATELVETKIGRNMEDALAILIPPLSANSKLPGADDVVALARKSAGDAIEADNWDVAGNIYSSLCAVCDTFGEGNPQSIKAQALASSFYVAACKRRKRSNEDNCRHEKQRMEDIKIQLRDQIQKSSMLVCGINHALLSLQGADGSILRELYPEQIKSSKEDRPGAEAPKQEDTNILGNWRDTIANNSKYLGWNMLHLEASGIVDGKAS